jgi:hypothetical protein
MNQVTKISLLTCYYIRKLLRQHANELKSIVAQGAALCADSQADLDQVLESLYLEEAEIAEKVRELETLTRWHQILVTQGSSDIEQLIKIEGQIFWILGFKRVAVENQLPKS